MILKYYFNKALKNNFLYIINYRASYRASSVINTIALHTWQEKNEKTKTPAGWSGQAVAKPGPSLCRKFILGRYGPS